MFLVGHAEEWRSDVISYYFALRANVHQSVSATYSARNLNWSSASIALCCTCARNDGDSTGGPSHCCDCFMTTRQQKEHNRDKSNCTSTSFNVVIASNSEICGSGCGTSRHRRCSSLFGADNTHGCRRLETLLARPFENLSDTGLLHKYDHQQRVWKASPRPQFTPETACVAHIWILTLFMNWENLLGMTMKQCFLPQY